MSRFRTSGGIPPRAEQTNRQPHNNSWTKGTARHLTLFVIIVLTALSATRRGLAQGTVYVSNLQWTYGPGGIGDIHGVFRGGAPYGSYAAHFSTGAGMYCLNTITLEFEFDSGYPSGLSAPWQLGVQLFLQRADGDVLLGNLANPVANPTPTPWPQSRNPNAYTTFFDFTPVQGVNLNAFSDYAVVLSMPASSPAEAALLFAMSSTHTSREGWTMSATTSGNPYETGEYLVMAVNATPIPEPDVVVLLSSALMIMAGPKLSRRVRALPI